MEGLIVLLVLAVLAVPVLLVIALVSVSGLKGRVASLEAQMALLHRRDTAAPEHAMDAATPAADQAASKTRRSRPLTPRC